MPETHIPIKKTTRNRSIDLCVGKNHFGSLQDKKLLTIISSNETINYYFLVCNCGYHYNNIVRTLVCSEARRSIRSPLFTVFYSFFYDCDYNLTKFINNIKCLPMVFCIYNISWPSREIDFFTESSIRRKQVFSHWLKDKNISRYGYSNSTLCIVFKFE